MQPARTNKTFSCFMSSDLNFFHCCLDFFQMRWVHIRKGFILSKCSLSLLWGHCLSACFPRVQQLFCKTWGSRSQQRLVLSWGTSRGRYADGRAPCWSCSVSLLWRFRVSSHNTLVCALSFTVNLPRGDLIISRRMQARFTLESHLQVYFLHFIIHVCLDVTLPHWAQSVKASDPPLPIRSGSHSRSEQQGLKWCFRWWRHFFPPSKSQ